jgi:hypothetical protein
VVPTNTTVTVSSGDIGLPFLRCERNPEEYLEGGITPRLQGHLGTGFDVTVAGAEKDLDLPGPLAPRPDEEGNGEPACAL